MAKVKPGPMSLSMLCLSQTNDMVKVVISQLVATHDTERWRCM